MSVSVISTNPTIGAATGTDANRNSIALDQKRASTDATAAAPLTVTALDPLDHTRLDKYLKAITTPMTLGEDAQNVANALVTTMQAVLKEPPDLANAHFDFKSSNGSIQVVSNSLSANDKNWLQGKLNSNTSLVQAVKAFHDDAVTGYASWADADGSPLTEAQSDDVSKKADGLVSFLDLFKSLGNDARQYQMKDGSYITSDGSPMDLAQDPTTAAGFLAFNKSAQASANGSFSFTSNSGHTLYGARMNIFEMNSSALPLFLPPSDTKTLGLNETA